MRPSQTEISLILMVCLVAQACHPARTWAGEQPPASRPTAQDADALFCIQKDGEFGYINQSGEIILSPDFKFLLPADFSDGLAGFIVDCEIVEGVSNLRYGYINMAGEVAIEPCFVDAAGFSEGLACVRVGEKWGYIDKTGRFVIEPQYDLAHEFSEGLALVNIGGDWRNYCFGDRTFYIDKTGRAVTGPRRLHFAYSFSDGLACVATEERRWGYIDKSGRYAIEPRFENAYSFREGLAPVRIQDKTGYIDKTGQMRIPPIFDSYGDFYEGLCYAENAQKRGFINTRGEFVITLDDEAKAGRFFGGLCRISRTEGGKIGFMDKTGRIVIEPQFDDVEAGFVHSLAHVRVGDRWGYINKQGKYVWKPTR